MLKNISSIAALRLCNQEFNFLDKDALIKFINILFHHSCDRHSLFFKIIDESLGHLVDNKRNKYDDVINIRLLRACTVMKKMYGYIYDPSEEAFSITDDVHHILNLL